MKLKNILLTALAIIAVSSCSHIDEDERYIYVKPAEIGRSVLIEDFTGQKCSNCPTANDVIKSLQEEYGEDNVIAVGIHSGPLGFKGNNKYSLGLWTETGEEYFYADYHKEISGQPHGVFNRVQESEAPTADWKTIVYNEIQRTAPMSINLGCTYNATNNTATIDINMVAIEPVNGKLQVWVVEDSIVAMQYYTDKENGGIAAVYPEYVHNHVFRSAVNGTMGEDVSIMDGGMADKQYTFTLDEKWIADNVSVVAFVYNNEGVQQVAKVPLISKEDGE